MTPVRAISGLFLTLAVLALASCAQSGGSHTRETTAPTRDSGMASVLMAESLVAEGRRDEAIAEFERAIAVNPTLTVAYLGIAAIYRDEGDYESAEEHYRTASRVEPRNFDAQYNHGLMLQLLDRVGEAVRAYLRALSIRPYDLDANLNVATAYLQLGEPDQALPFAERAVQLDGANGAARVNLGAVYSNLDRHADAVVEYQQAAELIELTPELLLNLADSLGKTERFEEMANTLLELLRIDPSAMAHERLGFARFKMGDYEGATGAFKSSLDLDPEYYPALNGVGVCKLNEYIWSDRTATEARDEAVAALRQSIRLKRNQPRIIDLLSRYD